MSVINKIKVDDIEYDISADYENITNTPNLADVATSGSYDDLSNKPTIPSNTSDLVNDSGFIDKSVNDLTYYTLATNTGATIELSINSSTYVMTMNLKNSAGTTISTGTVDLPLESVVVNGSYDSTNKKIILTLQSGSTIDIPVGDLVSGLQSEITSSNKLSADLIDDTNTTNKLTNANEKSTWNAKYDLPSGGIPSTDLSSAVQTSLGKADTAIQDISGKQDTLVSGTNIKTINSTSLLGSGDITISANADNIISFSNTNQSFTDVALANKIWSAYNKYGDDMILINKYNSSHTLIYNSFRVDSAGTEYENLYCTSMPLSNEVSTSSQNRNIYQEKYMIRVYKNGNFDGNRSSSWENSKTLFTAGTNVSLASNGTISVDLSSKQDIIQYSTMPTASSSTVGKIVQYTGTTDSTYTNGYFYQCVSDGESTPTYSWENINVQASSGGSTGLDLHYIDEIDSTIGTSQNPLILDTLEKGLYTFKSNSKLASTLYVKATSTNSSTKNTNFVRWDYPFIVLKKYSDTANDEVFIESAGRYNPFQNSPHVTIRSIKRYDSDNSGVNAVSTTNSWVFNQYVTTIDDQGIGGVKTFWNFPKCSSNISNLTDDTHLTTKKYVDNTTLLKAYQLAGLSEYSASSTYAVGDYVYYNNLIYKCNTAISVAEAWDSTHWTQKTYMEYMSDTLVGGALNGSY